MRCEYRLTEYDDNGDELGLEPMSCTADATHLSCIPFVGTKTCEKHKCRCAKPLTPKRKEKP